MARLGILDIFQYIRIQAQISIMGPDPDRGPAIIFINFKNHEIGIFIDFPALTKILWVLSSLSAVFVVNKE